MAMHVQSVDQGQGTNGAHTICVTNCDGRQFERRQWHVTGADAHHSRTTFVADPKRGDQNVAEYERRHNNYQPK